MRVVISLCQKRYLTPPAPQLLGVIILNLRTVFNNKILVQFAVRMFCSAVFYLLAFFPRLSWKQAMGLSPWQGLVLNST